MFAELFVGLGALVAAAPFEPPALAPPPAPDVAPAPARPECARRGRPPGRAHNEPTKLLMKLSHAKRKASQLTQNSHALQAALIPSRDTEAVAVAFGERPSSAKSARHCMIDSQVVSDRLSHMGDSWAASRTRGTGLIFNYVALTSFPSICFGWVGRGGG